MLPVVLLYVHLEVQLEVLTSSNHTWVLLAGRNLTLTFLTLTLPSLDLSLTKSNCWHSEEEYNSWMYVNWRRFFCGDYYWNATKYKSLPHNILHLDNFDSSIRRNKFQPWAGNFEEIVSFIVKRLGLGLGTCVLGPGTWDLGPGT